MHPVHHDKPSSIEYLLLAVFVLWLALAPSSHGPSHHRTHLGRELHSLTRSLLGIYSDLTSPAGPE